MIAVYAIGGKVQGVGDFVGRASTEIGITRHASRARTLGATGISVHGMGLSGEIGLDELLESLREWRMLRVGPQGVVSR